MDIERKISLGILGLAHLTDPWLTLHSYYRKLTIYMKAHKITARKNCTNRTSRRAEMLGILASRSSSPHLTEIMYSTKQLSVSKVIQIIRDKRIKELKAFSIGVMNV